MAAPLPKSDTGDAKGAPSAAVVSNSTTTTKAAVAASSTTPATAAASSSEMMSSGMGPLSFQWISEQQQQPSPAATTIAATRPQFSHRSPHKRMARSAPSPPQATPGPFTPYGDDPDSDQNEAMAMAMAMAPHSSLSSRGSGYRQHSMFSSHPSSTGYGLPQRPSSLQSSVVISNSPMAAMVADREQDLHYQITRLQALVHQKDKELRRASNELQTANSALTQSVLVNKELEESRKELASAQKRVTELESEVRRLTAENEDLKKQLAETRVRLQKIEKELSETKAELGNTKAELKVIKHHFDESRRRVAVGQVLYELDKELVRAVVGPRAGDRKDEVFYRATFTKLLPDNRKEDVKTAFETEEMLREKFAELEKRLIGKNPATQYKSWKLFVNAFSGIKQFRTEDAHLSPEEKTITLTELEKLHSCIDGDFYVDYQWMLKTLSNLRGGSKQPLIDDRQSQSPPLSQQTTPASTTTAAVASSSSSSSSSVSSQSTSSPPSPLSPNPPLPSTTAAVLATTTTTTTTSTAAAFVTTTMNTNNKKVDSRMQATAKDKQQQKQKQQQPQITKYFVTATSLPDEVEFPTTITTTTTVRMEPKDNNNNTTSNATAATTTAAATTTTTTKTKTKTKTTATTAAVANNNKPPQKQPQKQQQQQSKDADKQKEKETEEKKKKKKQTHKTNNNTTTATTASASSTSPVASSSLDSSNRKRKRDEDGDEDDDEEEEEEDDDDGLEENKNTKESWMTASSSSSSAAASASSASASSSGRATTTTLLDPKHPRRRRKDYKGGISKANGNNSWRVNFGVKGIPKQDRCFSWAKYGGKERALEMAENWRREMSDKLGLTTEETIPLSQLERVPSEIQQTIAGFFDGDGSVGQYGMNLHVTFSQSSDSGIPPVLMHIQNYYGGTVHLRTPDEKKPNAKPRYELDVTDRDELKIVLEPLNKYCILKHPQVLAALNWLKSIPDGTKLVSRDDPVRHELGRKLKAYKKEYHLVEVDSKKLTTPYLAGHVDADGSIIIGDSLTLDIAGKTRPQFLEAIKRLRGNGAVVIKEHYRCLGDNAKSFISEILPYSIVKKEQMKLGMKWKMLQEEHFGKTPPKKVKAEMNVLREKLNSLHGHLLTPRKSIHDKESPASSSTQKSGEQNTNTNESHDGLDENVTSLTYL